MHETHQLHIANAIHDDPVLAALSDVGTQVVDAIKGYEEMVDRAEDDLKPIVQRLLVLHRTHATEILEELERLGGRPADAGSAMGFVHSAVATVRDWLDALDASAIPAIADGEEQIIAKYDSAIADLADRPKQSAMLRHQRDGLQAQVDALRR